MMNLNELKVVYEHLGDDLSKEMFKNRLMFSISGDKQWVFNMACTIPELKEFFDSLDKNINGLVLFGGGYRGKQLLRYYGEYNWKCIIDNKPVQSEYLGLPVYLADDFLKEYCGETIVISSRIYEKEIWKQLVEAGVDQDKILNYGSILESLLHEQYFDLPALTWSDKEVFVDLGCWDGFTDIELQNKIGNRLNSVIAFEPDQNQALVSCRNLEKSEIKYVMIEKGAWSKEDTLRFAMNGTMLTATVNEGEKLPVTSVDNILAGKKVTYIKMDIEGAEVEAIKGCENTIKKHHPKLAICIYHKPEDIFEIPKQIMEYYSEYTLYIRHYSPYDVETVLYAIP